MKMYDRPVCLIVFLAATDVLTSSGLDVEKDGLGIEVDF